MANCLLLHPQNQWPVGFRFHPTDDELIRHYLKNKVLGEESLVQYIRQVDICNYEPWQLPDLSNHQTGDHQWFFFSAEDFKYSNGRKSNRTTRIGYWKPTGKEQKIMAPGTKNLIGTKKILVFHIGRSRYGIKTNWVIHEYHLHPDPNFAHLKSFVICVLKKKLAKNDNATRAEDERNGLLTSTNVATVNQNQEVLDHDLFELQSLLFSDLEPTSMDFQDMNSYGTHLNGATDGNVNSVLVDDENCFHEGIPSLIEYFNWKELYHMVNDQDQGGGFSGDTGMDTAFSWQNDHASPSFFGESACSGIQTKNMSIIHESRRSPLTSKIHKYREAKDLSSAQPLEDRLQTNWVYHQSDDSNRETGNFSSQHQPKSHKVLNHGDAQHQPKSHKVVTGGYAQHQLESHKFLNHVDALQNVQSKREAQLQVVSSLIKAGAVPNRIQVLRSAATSKKDTVEDQQSEVEKGVVYSLKSAGHGSLESGGKCFSSFLTTKCIHHKSSPASYFARTCVGFILFFTVAIQMLRYGN